MKQLPISKDSADVLIKQYGYTFNSSWGCSDESCNYYAAYPRAEMVIASSAKVPEVLLTVDDVLALQLMPIEAWDLYLKKYR